MAQEIRERYINPYTDFGFKKLFGTEMNKDLLISFLNALFMGHQNIKDISYLPMERLGIYGNRRAIFDVYCEDENGAKFIVEMQNVSQQYYKDRSVFYSTFPIQDQAKSGDEWDFNLKDVYTVGVLNFVFKDDEYLTAGKALLPKFFVLLRPKISIKPFNMTKKLLSSHNKLEF